MVSHPALFCKTGKKKKIQQIMLDRTPNRCYNTARGDEKHPLIYGPLAQLVRASGS